MITVYVRCSDGPRDEWTFDTLPRLGEWVVLQPYGHYKVVKIEHFPRPSGDTWDCEEDGVALRLLSIDHMTEPDTSQDL